MRRVTLRGPRWLVWAVVVLAGSGAIAGAFLIGRSSDSDSLSPATPRDRSVACSESAAKRATLRSRFAKDVRETGDFAALGEGIENSFPEGFFFDVERGFYIVELKCVDLDEDGEKEMIVGLGAGASGRLIHWAVFTPEAERGWRLSFARTGVPAEVLVVRDGALVELTPAYAQNDPNCCPTGQRIAVFDFVEDRFQMTSPASSGGDRLIAVGQSGVSRLGPLDVQSASPIDAQLAFGVPSYVPADPDEACPLTWNNLGLEIVFANLGGRDSCGSEGRIGSFSITGPAARHAGWETDGGARIGKRLGRLLQLYPAASFENGNLVLVSIPAPFGGSEITPALSATMFRGRALRLNGYVGAAGE